MFPYGAATHKVGIFRSGAENTLGSYLHGSGYECIFLAKRYFQNYPKTSKPGRSVQLFEKWYMRLQVCFVLLRMAVSVVRTSPNVLDNY